MPRACVPLLLSLLVFAAPAVAQTRAPDARPLPVPPLPGPVPTPSEPLRAAEPSELALGCTLFGRADLVPEALRAALERELGIPVILALDGSPAPLDVSADQPASARVRFTTPKGVIIERRVELPKDTGRAVETIVWVAGNLARDEAATLIDEYRVRAEAKRAAEAKQREAENKRAAQAQERAAEAQKSAEKPAPARPEKPASPRTAERPSAPLNLSLYHPISLYRDSERRRFMVELGLVYGRLGELRGFGFEVGLLSVEGPLTGVAFAGALDVDGPTTGYTASAIYSGGHDLTGVDTSLISYRRGDVVGAQLSGLFAGAGRVDGAIAATGLTIATNVRGAQLAAGLNLSQSVDGLIAAAGANLVRRVRGASLAAGANLSRDVEGVAAAAGANLVDRVNGASLAGGVNVSQEVQGVQIAVINIADRVHGAQIGVINVAREVDGAAVGVVSIAGNGEFGPVAYANNFAPLHAALKFRSGYAYSEVGVGLDPASDEYLLEAGAGAHLPVAGAFSLEPGIHHSITKKTSEAPGEGKEGERLHYRLRGVYGIGRHFDVFAGGGVRHGAWGALSGEVDPEFFAGVGVH